jgi:ribosome-binding ATPase YchF (GTP1/OBG family)
LSLQAGLEQEIAQMEPEEVSIFLKEFGLSEPVRNRLIQEAYNLLGLISFFTVGEDEVRAWTVPCGCTALLAAGEIHSDIQRGFIKAETISYENFAAVDFSMPEARKNAFLRLEGKQYIVQDGDIINFKFNV